MSTSNPPAAETPPPLNIPASSNTVDISIINTTSRIQNMPTSIFIEPTYKKLQTFDCPAFSFLITHHPTGSKYLFDLGVRKDWQNLAKPISQRISSSNWRLTITKNVSTILHEAGIPTASINGIIWSHHHWDHTGDPSTFPPSTALIVGPGFKRAFLPGYPRDPESQILESDYEGRELREVDFDDDKNNSNGGKGPLRIGKFRAVDFFGDGSFYLLDCPGHAIGHMSGLARTTTTTTTTNGGGQDSSSSTFILLGGDVAHHAGEFRPTPYLPLPPHFSPNPIPSTSINPGMTTTCPGEIMAAQHHRLSPDRKAWTSPFVEPSGNAANDLDKAKESIQRVGELDGHGDVFTCLAHDASLVGGWNNGGRGVVGFFPDETANEWKEKGWRERSLWSWVGDYYGGVVGEGGEEGE